MKKIKHFYRFMAVLLCLSTLLLCGCRGDGAGEGTSESPATDPETDAPVIASPVLLGNGLTLSVSDAEQRGLDMERVVSLAGAMNLKTVQVEIRYDELLTERAELLETIADWYDEWFSELKKQGVEHILLLVTGGMWPAEYGVSDLYAFPYPDSEADSQYTEYLELYGKGMAALASRFPEVGYLQAGKGMNLDENAHPVSSKNRFSSQEKAALAVDLAHAAHKALQAAGSGTAVVFSGVSASEGFEAAENFLSKCFAYMAEGSSPYGVLTAADSFDAIAWEPDACWYSFDAESFVSGNAALYRVVSENSAAGMPILLSGFDFSDYGSRLYDEQQGEWLGEICRAISEQMPYIAGFYPAALLESGDKNDETAMYSGVFRVFSSSSFGAKEKAKALCSLYKGEAGQLDQYKENNQVYTTRQGDARYGIGFPIKGAEERKLNIARIMDLLETMNVQTMRNWMNIPTLLTSPTSINEHEVELQKQWIAQLDRRGISKIIGMSQGAFWPESTNIVDTAAVPYRDTDADSLYMSFLEKYEQSWYTLASTFPEIDYWEVGNETNSDNFLHPITFTTNSTKFTSDEKAQITADMCYVAAKAIRRANPEATVIFPGMAPIKGFSTMVSFLERVYNNIESGKCIGGTDPDAYFDAIAWHCYYFSPNVFTAENWLEGNNSVYAVMQAHGDGDKKVFLTEFGFSDGGNQAKDAEHAEFLREIFRLADQMPYVEGFYPFRTVEDETAASWGGSIEIYYGMFRVFGTENFGAKEKAKALCEIYGGDASKLDQYIGSNKVYS